MAGRVNMTQHSKAPVLCTTATRINGVTSTCEKPLVIPASYSIDHGFRSRSTTITSPCFPQYLQENIVSTLKKLRPLCFTSFVTHFTPLHPRFEHPVTHTPFQTTICTTCRLVSVTWHCLKHTDGWITAIR
jgi:hypothetical protein